MAALVQAKHKGTGPHLNRQVQAMQAGVSGGRHLQEMGAQLTCRKRLLLLTRHGWTRHARQQAVNMEKPRSAADLKQSRGSCQPDSPAADVILEPLPLQQHLLDDGPQCLLPVLPTSWE